MKDTFSLYIIFMTLLFVSCGGCGVPFQADVSGNSLHVLSYNVQNLFDDVSNGSEYYEYDPARGEWTTSLFHRKLLSVSEVLLDTPTGGADILVLQEVENRNTVETLRDHYLKGAGYRYIAVSKAPDSAIQLICMSRFPFLSSRSHTFYIESVPKTRPVFECTVDIDGTKLVLLINHWKSKSGGAEETEVLRIAAAELVKRRSEELLEQNPHTDILIIGDMNERVDEYVDAGQEYITALMPEEEFSRKKAGEGSIFLTGNWKAADGKDLFFTPWLTEERLGVREQLKEKGEPVGSYVYGGQWERIDNVLIGPSLFDEKGIEYSDFRLVDSDYLLGEDGFPFAWSRFSGSGYSDHLPLLVTLTTGR